jgi:hypothetical protein
VGRIHTSIVAEDGVRNSFCRTVHRDTIEYY